MTLKEQITWCKAQIKSGYEVMPLRSILARLQGLENKEPPSAYHQQAVKAYEVFLNHYHLPFLIDGRQGKALKELLEKLKGIATDKTDQGAFNSFVAILQNWEKVGSYHGKIKTLHHINQNLLEIIDKIKNGATKKQSHRNEAERFHNELTQSK